MMPLIPEATIDEIQTRSDIAELIGRFVPLKRVGHHYTALCPFHKEKTPSFSVNTDKQIFHCFGCGVGGNVFGFLMQHDHLTFPEAVRQLGEHVGVPVPRSDRSGPDGQSERLSALMENICSYFERRLADPQHGRAARAYLTQRGVGAATQAAFRLGVAPPGWSGLLRAAEGRNIPRDLLEQAGLTIRGRNGDYDRFRNRLIFPILDTRRRVVGFGGRSLDAQEPKYLNSPQTPLYHKGRHLFGLAQAKEAIIAHKMAIIVEGYFDCVVLAEAGFSPVVSPLGTALTEEQVRLLKRYTQTVMLAFDADAAGEMATLRGIDLLVESGCEVSIAPLPSGVDPDDYLRRHGRARFEQLLAERLGIFEFLVRVAGQRFPLEHPEGRVRAAQFILPTITKVPNAMLRSEYVRLLADRLHLDESAVLEELKKASPRQTAPVAAEPPRGIPPGPERLLVALLLEEPARWDLVKSTLSLDEVTEETLRRIVAVIAESAGGTPVSVAQVVSRLTAEGNGALATALVEDARTIPSKEEALRDCVRRLHGQARKRREAQLREAIRMAQAAGQDGAVQELLTTYQQVVTGGGD